MIYYIADCHFGHSNIIRHCGRPFSSVDEMDAALLRNWQARVQPQDTIYILGDLMFFCPDPLRYLEQLPGRKHLITGNHDATWMNRSAVQPERYFQSIGPMAEIHDGPHRLTLCHYPMMTWNHIGQGSFLVYGHIHNSTSGPYWPLLRQMEQALNAGVDVNHFAPATLEELVENNRLFRAQPPSSPGDSL